MSNLLSAGEMISQLRVNEVGVCVNAPLGIGRHGELMVLNLLDGAIDRNVDNCNAKGYDVLYKGVKLDVKTSSLKTNKKTGKNGAWGFGTESTNCDYYILTGLDNQKNIRKLFLIPFEDIQRKTVTIGANKSKWDKYFVKESDLKIKITEVRK